MSRKFLLIVGVCWSLAIALIFQFMGIEPLDEAGQIELKKGKSFWKWESPYGKLATHYVEVGTGHQHIFFIHGFRGHTFTWRHLINPLADAGFHVWSIDLIGYGLSDKPDNVPYDSHFFIQQIFSFMEHNRIPSAHFVGNSMGGSIALSLSLENPSKVRSLMLISALGYPQNLPLYLAITRHLPPLWKPFLGPTMVRNSLKRIVYKTEKITDEQVDAYYMPYRLPGGSHATLETLKQYDNKKLRNLCKRYGEIKKPLLIIWGEYDDIIPLYQFHRFKSDFPTAHTIVISDCGHMAQEEEPEQVLESMIKFLQR